MTREEIAGAYKRLFGTDDGKVVLGDLENTFVNRKLFGPDTHMTVGRAAQKDVVWHIHNILKGGGEHARKPGRK